MTGRIGLLAFSCAVGMLAGHAAAQAPDLLMRIQNTDLGSSIDQPGLMPWHLKMNVQLFDAKGAPAEQGTVEQWWSAPGRDRITYTFPSYNSTVVRTSEGTFRTDGSGSPPYFVEYVRRQVVHPMPTGAELSEGKPDLRKESVDKMDFDCIMIDQPIPQVAYPPLGLFPTYCMQRGLDVLRVSYDFGTQVTLRRKIGLFQKKTVALDLSVGVANKVVATAVVEQLQARPAAYPEASMVEGLENEKTQAAARVAGGVMAGQIVTKVPPIYPQAAKAKHHSGTVVMRAVIGTDGHIHSLKLVSVPDPDLAIAAVDAVRQWVYKPYLLNGEPAEVDTTITVNFNISP